MMPKPERPAGPPTRRTGAVWLVAWRELATITDGITKDDPRFQSVMAALDVCDEAYLAGDWVAFEGRVKVVRELVAKHGVRNPA